MNDFEKCKAYQIKKPADGICVGENDEKCKSCPAYINFKNLSREELTKNNVKRRRR